MKTTALLTTRRLSFRPFEMDDFEKMRSLDTDREVVRYLGHGRVRDAEETRHNMEKISADYAQYGMGLYAAELAVGGEFVGRTGLIPWVLENDLVWEVGYTLSKKFWGQGFATEAASFWKGKGFELLPVPFLVSLIHPQNQASIHVAEKIGMRLWKHSELNGYPLAVFRIDRS
jgi:RimJ/RimL family protein N-acetyltransferase